MKTKLFFLCAAVVTLLSLLQKEEENIHSSLSLMNIEALASSEGGGPSGVICMGYGSIDCPISSVKVFYVN